MPREGGSELEEKIYTPYDDENCGKMTAPLGAGPLRRVRPDHPLGDVDDDRSLTGRDRQPDAVLPTADADHEDLLTLPGRFLAHRE